MQDSFIIAVLMGYIAVGAALVVFLGGLRGVLAAIIIGWLFLPPVRGINLPGLPVFTKEYSVPYAVLLGVILSDSARLFSFRPKLIDLPILIFILSPLPSSITNGLGAYDGMAAVYANIFNFGVPYYMGRIYIRTPNDVKTVANWIVIAGLIAAPLALWEVRMSPQLNAQIYGYHAADFHMSNRLGGYRPMLFMRHGLEVGLWLATAGAVAVWLWITTKRQTRILGFSIQPLGAILLVSTVVSRSLGSIILLGGTTACALFVRTTGLRLAMIAMILTPSIYLSVRITDVWSPDQFTSIIRSIDERRAMSFESRLEQEIIYSQHALKKPMFGWGGYGRYRPINERGEVDAVDGLTTIIFGENGLVGLSSFLAMIALPSLLMVIRVPKKALTTQLWAPALAIMLGVSIFSIDMMFNAFHTPLHIFGIGVIASVAIHTKQWQRVILAHQRKAITDQLAKQSQAELAADDGSPPQQTRPLRLRNSE